MEDVFESSEDLMHSVENDLKFSVQVSGDSLNSFDRFKKHGRIKSTMFSRESAILSHVWGSNIMCNVLTSDLSGGIDVQSDSVILGTLTADMTPTPSGFPVENDEYHLDLPSAGFSSITEAIEDIRNGKCNGSYRQESYDRKYYEKVQWKNFSHVCTAPVESNEDLAIVTGAQLQVADYGIKKLLFLRLRFSYVIGAIAVRYPEWDGSPGLARKSGLISTLISHHFTAVQKPSPQPADVNINSAIYPGGPPGPAHAPKLLKFVDTTEMTRGPQETPGYWVVSGARLVVEMGKISIRVKYSLLTIIQPDDDEVSE